MPSTSDRQRKFMGAELGRAKAGKKTRTGMSVGQLEEFARKPLLKDTRKANPRSPRSGR